MHTKEILIKRLSTIKLLYKIGLNLSYQNENVAFFSVLTFHDSIEMFLTLAAEHNNINSDHFKFLEYWKHLTLSMKGNMNALNNRRNNLKHKGLIPAKAEIEASRVHTTDFFNQNTKPIFDIEFSEVSLFELVTFPSAKKLLVDADQSLQKGDIDNCIEKVTKAFYELLREYKENKDYFGGNQTHFDFIHPIKIERHELDEYNPQGLKNRLENLVNDLNKNFEKLERALAMVTLGIDYRKYAKFMILTPVCTKILDGDYVLELTGPKIWNQTNCEFLIDFVLECALRLQEFDFNNLDLIGSENFLLSVLNPITRGHGTNPPL